MNFLSFKIKVLLCYFALFILLFLSARIAIFACASNYFAPLGKTKILLSFLHGLRFDFHMLGIFIFPLFISFLLPFKNKFLIKLFCYIFSSLFSALSIFLLGDIIFFITFNHHISSEILTSLTHFGLFTQMALKTYWFITFPLIFFFVLTLYYIFNTIDKKYPSLQTNKNFILKSILLILILSLIALLAIRGKTSLHGRPLDIIDAQVLADARSSDLILNGCFTTYEALRRQSKRKLYFDDKILPFATAQEFVPDESYPFEKIRKNFNHKNNNYNFVLILLESFDPIIIEKYSNAAPAFMEIKRNSLYYKNFFSSGTRSLLGVSATLLSIPYTWKLPTMLRGLGAKNMSRIALYFKSKGYKTINVITDLAGPDCAKNFSSYVGFEEFYSKEDIPVHRNYPLFNKGFDWEGFEFLLDKLNNINGKFFAYFYTSSAHTPFNILLSKEFAPYPQDSEEHQFLNRIAYTDGALNNFFTKAKEEPWFKNTIFLILPDHRAPIKNRKISQDNITRDKFASFLLIYAPYIFPTPEEKDIYATQEDILPTMLDLLNSEESFSSFGQSLFDASRAQNKYIFEENKNTIHVIGPTVNKVFSEQTLLDINTLGEEEKRALHLNESVYKLLKKDSWRKK